MLRADEDTDSEEKKKRGGMGTRDSGRATGTGNSGRVMVPEPQGRVTQMA